MCIQLGELSRKSEEVLQTKIGRTPQLKGIS